MDMETEMDQEMMIVEGLIEFYNNEQYAIERESKENQERTIAEELADFYNYTYYALSMLFVYDEGNWCYANSPMSASGMNQAYTCFKRALESYKKLKVLDSEHVHLYGDKSLVFSGRVCHVVTEVYKELMTIWAVFKTICDFDDLDIEYFRILSEIFEDLKLENIFRQKFTNDECYIVYTTTVFGNLYEKSSDPDEKRRCCQNIFKLYLFSMEKGIFINKSIKRETFNDFFAVAIKAACILEMPIDEIDKINLNKENIATKVKFIDKKNETGQNVEPSDFSDSIRKEGNNFFDCAVEVASLLSIHNQTDGVHQKKDVSRLDDGLKEKALQLFKESVDSYDKIKTLDRNYSVLHNGIGFISSEAELFSIAYGYLIMSYGFLSDFMDIEYRKKFLKIYMDFKELDAFYAGGDSHSCIFNLTNVFACLFLDVETMEEKEECCNMILDVGFEAVNRGLFVKEYNSKISKGFFSNLFDAAGFLKDETKYKEIELISKGMSVTKAKDIAEKMKKNGLNFSTKVLMRQRSRDICRK